MTKIDDIEIKNFSVASNARRSAKQAGLAPGEFTLYKEGNWFKIRVGGEPASEAPAPGAVKAAKAAKVARVPKVAKIAKPPRAPKAVKSAKVKAVKKSKAAPKAPKAKPVGMSRPGTKNAQLVDMVSRGATISELIEALGWLPHTVRAALSRLNASGQTVTRTKVGTADDGFESHYKIAS